MKHERSTNGHLWLLGFYLFYLGGFIYLCIVAPLLIMITIGGGGVFMLIVFFLVGRQRRKEKSERALNHKAINYYRYRENGIAYPINDNKVHNINEVV